MRLSVRTVGIFMIAVTAVMCTDLPTAPGASRFAPGRLAISPSLSPDAVRAYSALAASGFEITNAHLRVSTTDGKLVKDSVLYFAPNNDTLRVEIPVAIQGMEQIFGVTLELRTATGLVLFAGRDVVRAVTAALPPGPSPTIAIGYAGPGKDARTVSVVARDSVVLGTGSTTVAASARDGAGSAVNDLLVTWRVSDSTLATLTGAGNTMGTLRGTGRRGVVLVTATTPLGISGTARVSLLPAPARTVVVSGDGQSDVGGRSLAQPFVVEVRGADDGPVPGVAVAFRAATAGATVATASATTNAAGRASTLMTLGRTAGVYRYEAVVGSLAPVTVSATATTTAGSATTLQPLDGATTGSVGGTTTLRALVTDANGTPVAGQVVAWNVASGGGSVEPSTSTTDDSGIAQTSWTFGSAVGDQSATASVSGLVGSPARFTVRVSGSAPPAGPSAARYEVAASTLSPEIGQPVRITAQVVDRSGAPMAVAGRTVTWSVSPSAGRFANATSATDAAGVAAVTYTASSTPATSVTVSATDGTLSGTTPTITTVASSASRLAVVGSLPNTVRAGESWSPAPEVQLVDGKGNAVAQSGVTITAAIASGPTSPAPTLAGGTATTDGRGRATFATLAVGGAVGRYVLSFSAPGFAPVSASAVTLTPASPDVLTIVAGDGQTAPAGSPVAIAPEVEVRDAFGNVVSGASVEFTTVTAGSRVSAGNSSGASVTVTTDGAGRARVGQWTLGPTAQQYRLTASVAGARGGPVTFTATARTAAAVAARLVFARFSPRDDKGKDREENESFDQIVVAVTDSSGNTVVPTSDQIQLSLRSGDGRLKGTTLRRASNGIAVFDDISVDKADSYQLVATSPTSPSLIAAVSPVFTIVKGSTPQIGFLQQPSDVKAGKAMQPPVRVAVTDRDGTVLTAASGSVTLSLVLRESENQGGGSGNGGSSAVLSGGTASIVNGVAVFPALSVSGAGRYALRAVASVGGVAQGDKIKDETSKDFTVAP